MDAGARLFIARLARRARAGAVCFIEDVGEPVDDGRYVTLQTYCDGEPVVLLVLTVENFYTALERVVRAMAPHMLGDPLH